MKKVLLFLGLFVIALAQKVSAQVLIFSPNGGETLIEGETYQIRWYNAINEFTRPSVIYYKYDGQTKAIAFLNGTDSTYRSYYWTVPPGLGGTTGRIHISTGYTYTSDSSDADFSIHNAVAVVSPNGGESLKEGQTHVINWKRNNPAVSKVDMWVVHPNGSRSIHARGLDASWPYFHWKVPYFMQGGPYKIELRGKTSTGIEYSDESDNGFYVEDVPELKLVSPVEGETFIKEKHHYIQWKAEPSITGEVAVWLLGDNGSERYLGSASASNRYFWWYLAPPVAEWDKLPESGRIVLKAYGAHGSIADTSGTIHIRQGLKLLYPNGGQTLAQGSTYNITWQVNDTISKVNLSYLYNGWYYTIATHVDATQGVYAWTVPHNLNQAGQVVISSAFTSYIKDSSDALVYIQPTAHIRVKYPNGGENYVLGDQLYVGWEAYNLDNVNVELTLNGGTTWQTLGTYRANGANGGMSIPTTQFGIGTQGKIRVSASSNSSLRDESDGYFTVQPRTLQVLRPSYGAKLTPFSTYTIQWEANTTNTYKLSYSTDGGSTWKTIHAGPYSGTSYNWTVPEDYSSNCLVKVATYSGTLLEANSQPFRIAPYDFKVTAPNGTYHQEKKTATVKWTDVVWGSSYTYNIDFRSEEHAGWRRLATGISSDAAGIYSRTITIPNLDCGYSSSTAQVQISRVSNGVVQAIRMSNYFSVADGPDLDCGDGKYRMAPNTSAQSQTTKQGVVKNEPVATGGKSQIYPNPARHTVTLNLQGFAIDSKTTQLKVYSTTGTLVLQKTTGISNGGAQTQLDVASLPPGTYLINISDGQQTQNISFVKQ